MTLSKYEKWQMDLVTAAEMAETGLAKEEVIRRFGEVVTAETNTDEAEGLFLRGGDAMVHA
jgi:hypothetical protein